MSPRFSLVLVVFVTAFEVGVMAGCTDGTTPNCSDAAAGCSPDLDGTVPEAGPRESGEGAPPGDAVAADAAPGVDAADGAGNEDADAATDAKDG
jgi:hypothetical protein